MSAHEQAAEVTPADAGRQTAALNHLLGEIGLSASETSGWWNRIAHPELGGRTPTQAWLAGDTDAVRALVEQWYAASRSAATRAANNPSFLAMLRDRLHELDERHPPGQRLHHTS